MNKAIYQVDAKYQEQEIESHQGNPSIEALPHLLDHDEWTNLLTFEIKYDSQHRQNRKIVRQNRCQEIKRIFIPLSKSVALAVDFDTLLRSGYADRNPFSPSYRKKVLDQLDNLESERQRMDEFDNAGITTSGIHVVGLSGIGKTRSISRILARYPQIIVHTKYREIPHLVKQLVYLKIDCPENGRPGDLAEDALRKMDELLETNYYGKYSTVNKRLALGRARNLMAGFLRVANIHHLGVLIIDEIQNLHGSKEGRVLLNTLVKMSNEFDIPIILIGTPKAEHVLTKEFRQLRRGNALNDYGDWRQMRNDNSNADWDNFVEKMWQYQYTTETAELTKEIKDAIYKYSAGISDIAIKFFISAQTHAILNDTKISAALLRYVGNEEFAWAKKAAEALQLGTPQALMQYEDLYFINVKSQPVTEIPNLIPPFPQSTNDTEERSDAKNDPNTRPSKKEPSKSPKNKKGVGAGYLAETVKSGQEENKSAYDSLKSVELVASIAEYLD
jgi:hypothetical protein